MASSETPGDVPTMKLKVLSNAEEVGNHVFDNIPVTRTVGWIKRHLQNTLPSHPPADGQRILYQARFLDNDDATLAQIFGEPVPEERAFHLVLKAPRASRLNPAASDARTASAPPDASRAAVTSPGQPGPPQQRVQVQSQTVHPPHIELNIGDIGFQIQQALDQAQAQLHQAGFTHVQIPRVGTQVQTAAQGVINGALQEAGLQRNAQTQGATPGAGSDAPRPSVTVNQQLPEQSGAQYPHGQHNPHQHPAIHPANVRITQTMTGMPMMPPQMPGMPFGGSTAQAHMQHMEHHQRAMEMARHQQQQILQHMRPNQAQSGQPSQQQTNQSQLNAHQPVNGRLPHVHAHPQGPPGAAGPFPIGIHVGGVVQTGPFPMMPGMPMPQVFGQQQIPGIQGPMNTIRAPSPHIRGGNGAPPNTSSRATTPAQADARTSTQGGDASNFADRMQQIQRELEQVTRRTQELSSQRMSAIGQMPSSVQQSELRDGFRTLSESLQRIQTTLDALASDPVTSRQPGFVPLRTLVQDWLIQVQAAEADTSRWTRPLGTNNETAAPLQNVAAAAVPDLQPSVTAAFPPVATPATSSISIGLPADNLMLLRDPSGQPHALLVGPHGSYRTPDLPQDIVERLFSQVQRPPANRNDSFSRFMRRAVGLPEGRRQHGQVPPPDLRQALMDRLRVAGAQANQPAQPAQPGQAPIVQAQVGEAQRPPNEAVARDLLRGLLGPLWLFIRVAGMMYLFGGVGNGISSWFQWRPLGIALMMVVAWLAQQPWMRRRMDAVRVHFEQLFGVPLARNGDVQPQEQNQPAPEGAAAPERTAAERARQAIARVERPNQDAPGSLRERLRSVERAVALFAASFVPGMGEGIVQARQIAEMEARTAAEEAARRQREQEEAAVAALATESEANVTSNEDTAADTTVVSTDQDATAGSSTQVDMPGVDGNSELSRVNKGKDAAVGGGENPA